MDILTNLINLSNLMNLVNLLYGQLTKNYHTLNLICSMSPS